MRSPEDPRIPALKGGEYVNSTSGRRVQRLEH